MSDMYGAIRSKVFEVKDVEAFKEWFSENCYFGEDTEVWGDRNGIAFGSYEQYPSAYPRMPMDEDDDERAEWDIDAFADAIRAHFADDKQVLEVVSAGNEKLCYVAAQRLVITATTVTFEDWYAGN